MLNSGNGPFVDVQTDGNAVLRQLFRRGLHPGIVTALANIGAKDLKLQTLQSGALEYLTFFQAGTGQRIHQHLGFDILVTVDLNRGNGRPFLYRQNQHAAVATGLHIGKHATSKQFLDRVRQFRLINLFTDVDRESGKHRTCRDPLKAFHFDIRDREFICHRRLGTGGTDREANSYS